MKPPSLEYRPVILMYLIAACFLGTCLFSEEFHIKRRWAAKNGQAFDGKLVLLTRDFIKLDHPNGSWTNIPLKDLHPNDRLYLSSLFLKRDEALAEYEAYMANKRYAEAIPSAQRRITLCEAFEGSDHLITADSIFELARLHRHMRNYSQAEPLYQRALQIYERRFGLDHFETARFLVHLAELYEEWGDYPRSEAFYQRILPIYVKQFGPNDPKAAICLNNLAHLSQAMGNYAQAEPLYQQSRVIMEIQPNPNYVFIANTWNNLAVLYQAMGNYAAAEPLFQKALLIKETQFGVDAPDNATSLSNLAELYKATKKYALAKPLYERCLQLREKSLGPDAPDTATSLGNLAGLHRMTGNFAEAEPLYRRALNIYQKQFGPDDVNTAKALHHLAELYMAMGEYPRAEPLFHQSLQIRKKHLNLYHPDTASTLSQIAFLSTIQDNRTVGLEYARASAMSETGHLEQILSFTNETERLAYQRTLAPFNLPGTLEAGLECANAVIRYKGIILESLLEDRRTATSSKDPDSVQNLARIRELKNRLKPVLMGSNKGNLSQAEVLVLQKQLAEAEKSLARHVSGLERERHSVTVQDVKEALPGDMALVEYFRYDRFLGKDQWEATYGAVVIRRDSEPAFVRCGSAEQIETAIRAYLEAIKGVADAVLDDDAIKARGRELYDILIAGLVPHLNGVNKLTICPDADLHFLPFATLLDERGRFLAETTFLYHIASGRDLIEKPGPRITNSPPFVAGDVLFSMETDFAGTAAANVRSPLPGSRRSGVGAEFAQINLIPLPGTLVEMNRVVEVLNARPSSPGNVISATGARVTEAALRSLKSPEILHLATHGFSMPDVADSMFGSGIALSGAQNTMTARAQGMVPDPDNDGLLLAAEVVELNLQGTELVTLSACETARGEIVSGEGVLGMRRAFAMAGARNVLMTLWDIADEPTAGFMEDFYLRCGESPNKPLALSEIQREWLVRLREEEGLAMSVYLAGPFVMSAQAKKLQ